MFEAKEIITNSQDWIAAIFFVILLLLVILKNNFDDRLKHTSLLFFSKKHVSIYFNKEKTSMLNLFQILFFLIQILFFSLLFYVSISYYNASFSELNYKTFFIFLLGTSLYFGFRFVLGLFLATVLNLENIHKKILFEKINYFNVLTMWMLPFVLFLSFTSSNQKMYLIFTLALLGVLLLVRYALILRNNKSLLFNNLFYFILYLCALEIAPLVLILKLTI